MFSRNEGNEDLTISVYAGWQKRGSGRSFDSLSGRYFYIKIIWRLDKSLEAYSLIDWIEFYAVSAILQPCNGGDY